MLRSLLAATLLAILVSVAAVFGQEPASSPNRAPAPTIPLIKLAPQKTGRTMPALKYQFLPDLLDQTAGNAAPFWLRAGMAARGVKEKPSEKHWKWVNPTETPLTALPRKEVQAYLQGYAQALQLAEDASRRDRCDWEMPPLTLQNLSHLQLDELQAFRELANLLSLRCRLELAEGDFDKAVRTLQIGFIFARHVGETDILVQTLVGIAIEAIMLSRVEEMIQLPGAPNLYWALTNLPTPLVDGRRAIRSELNILHRSFPQLREAARKPLSVEEMNRLVDDFGKSLGQWEGASPPPWATRLGLASLAIKVYPDAKKSLIAHGRPTAEVEAMPTLQVVVVHLVEQYDEMKDEYLKWLSLPPWQMWAGLEGSERQLRPRMANPPTDLSLFRTFLPAVLKIVGAQLRTEWQVAGLRTAEALRLYAAGHKGQPPEKLDAITEVPLPIDPFTGKSFDANYAVKDGKGILELPAPARMPILIGRRYELAPGAE
jgi:hypothetical protein